MSKHYKQLILLSRGAVCVGVAAAVPLIDWGGIVVDFINAVAQVVVTLLLGGTVISA